MTPVPHPRIALNGVSSKSWSLDEDLQMWAELGVHHAVLSYDKVGAPGVQRATDQLQRSGVHVESVCLGRAFRLDDPATWPADVSRLVQGMTFAENVGATSVYVTTGPSGRRMTADDSLSAFCEAIAPVALAAQGLGLRLAVEQNHPMNHDTGCIHTFEDLLEVARKSKIDIVVEIQNCWLEGGLAEKFSRGASAIGLVQVSDFAVGTETRLSRLVPGDGDIPLESVLGTLLDAGYDGVFDIEVLGPAIENEGYRASITRGVEWLSQCLTKLGA